MLWTMVETQINSRLGPKLPIYTFYGLSSW